MPGSETPESRWKEQHWPFLLTQHAFEKLRSVDMTLAEFESLLVSGEVIEETALGIDELKEVVLILDWSRPLHVVVVVDDLRREERILTVYEPDPHHWSPDYRRRRR